MENTKATTLEELGEERAAEQKEQEHKNFVLSMKDKSFKELNLQQQSYLYTEHNKLYMELVENKEQRVNNLLAIDRLKAKEKAAREQFAAEKAAFIEQENNKTEQERKFEQMIAASIDESLKKFNLY